MVLESEDGRNQIVLENSARVRSSREAVMAAVARNVAALSVENLEALERRFSELTAGPQHAGRETDPRDLVLLIQALKAAVHATRAVAAAVPGTDEFVLAKATQKGALQLAQFRTHLARTGMRDEDAWSFRMYGRRPGETPHEVRADLRHPGRTRSANLLTLVVLHGHKVPQLLAGPSLKPDVFHRNLQQLAASLATIGLWNRRHGLPLPETVIQGTAPLYPLLAVIKAGSQRRAVRIAGREAAKVRNQLLRLLEQALADRQDGRRQGALTAHDFPVRVGTGLRESTPGQRTDGWQISIDVDADRYAKPLPPRERRAFLWRSTDQALVRARPATPAEARATRPATPGAAGLTASASEVRTPSSSCVRRAGPGACGL
ncbi:hypothetical protein [Streptomyces griseorubiginosus]